MKSVKKDKGRFNISFDLNDLRHRRVVDVLNTAGRRKAALIVDATMFYLAHLERSGTEYGLTGSLPLSDTNTQRNIQSDTSMPTHISIPSTHAENAYQSITNTTKADIDPAPIVHENDEMRQAALEGLSMFNSN